MSYTDENIEKLASVVVDSWDMDTLVNYAKERLFYFYQEDKKEFEKDWEAFKDELSD